MYTHCPICNLIEEVVFHDDKSFTCLSCINTINSLVDVIYTEEKPTKKNKTAIEILSYINAGGEDVKGFIEANYNL